MNSKILVALVSMMLFVSCSHDYDLYQPPVDSAEEKIKSNVENVFGVTFDPNHDWRTTASGELTIQADASVKKVQLLVKVRDLYGDDLPSYVTDYDILKLNEAETNGRTTIKMSYDVPKENLGLYVAFITDEGNIYKKVEGGTVSINDTESAKTRTLSTGYMLPLGEFKIAKAIPSYANERGWVEGEMLYELSDDDYKALKMSSPDYSTEFKQSFRNLILGYFKNGRLYNNLPLVISSGIYNDKAYPITTGDEPIIVTPAYKCDNPIKYGYEVWNSDLYYYYFKADAVKDMTDAQAAAYFKSLPKYKAIPFSETFDMTEDDVIGKHGSFALLYFGDDTPTTGTVGSFKFPHGYNIGFMIRAKTEAEDGVKKGEVYGDGRLNDKINVSKDYNFKSSGMDEDDPRATWLNINKKLMITWESGTDADFNDVILEVEGGIEGPTPPPSFNPITYTYCFEDTELGDYDMNDIVIKAVRQNETTIEYSIVACGAYDELFVNNLNYGNITDTKEIHELFGTTPGHFVNTDGGQDYTFITGTRTVSSDFTLTDEPELQQPYITNKTTGKEVRLSKKGQDPHGILVAYDFHYPLEQVRISEAYPLFNNWGMNAITSTWWYMSPIPSKVY